MLNVYLVDRSQFKNMDMSSASHILSPEELTQAKSYSHSADRIVATGDRMVLRILLAMFAPGTHQSLSIQRDFRGKPYLEGIPLHFNLSHSESVLAIALSTQPVGVDVEQISMSTDIDSISEAVFTSDEASWLGSMDETMRVRKFTELWSLKEAHLKRLGIGIAGGLTRLKRIRCGKQFVLSSEDSHANYYSLMCARHILALSSTCSRSPCLNSLHLANVANKPVLIQTQLSQPWSRHPVRFGFP